MDINMHDWFESTGYTFINNVNDTASSTGNFNCNIVNRSEEDMEIMKTLLDVAQKLSDRIDRDVHEAIDKELKRRFKE